MCFYDKFAALCKEKGVSETRALIEADLSKSLRTKWMNKPETVPNGESLTKLSKYFNVPIDYFMDLGIKKAPAGNSDEGKEFEEIFSKLNEKNKSIALAQLKALLDNQ